MLTDFKQIEPNTELNADICVVGGGAAGISIARELIDEDCSVLLLESGGKSFDPEIQRLYEGVNSRDDFALDSSRLRYFGGSTNHWGGWCAPFDEIDFVKRDWVPNSGWPITYDVLAPYYRRAQQVCGLGDYRYDVAEWPSQNLAALRLDPEKLEHKMWQISPPTIFGRVYEKELTMATNLKVILNATVTQVVTDANGSTVTAVSLADLHGRRATVRAAFFVIACGGIESPRLLLASNHVHSAGIGNKHDLVGRFFMEHPHPDAGGILLTGDAELLRAYSVREVEGERIVTGFGPSPAAQQRLRILNSSIVLSGPLRHGPSEGWDSLTKLSRSRQSGEWPEGMGSHVAKVLRDLDDVLAESYRRATEGAIKGFQLVGRTELVPNRENRLTLAYERDALDVNRIRLDWKVGSLDRSTVATTMKLLAEELGRLNVARVRVNELLFKDDSSWSENLSWFGHHMGTTRMDANPKRGVVDTDCRVHGVSNLFIASGSVFPTCSFANPTLTIVAIALRLADHLKTKVSSGV